LADASASDAAERDVKYYVACSKMAKYQVVDREKQQQQTESENP
jgi:hypothetical protein